MLTDAPNYIWKWNYEQKKVDNAQFKKFTFDIIVSDEIFMNVVSKSVRESFDKDAIYLFYTFTFYQNLKYFVLKWAIYSQKNYDFFSSLHVAQTLTHVIAFTI